MAYSDWVGRAYEQQTRREDREDTAAFNDGGVLSPEELRAKYGEVDSFPDYEGVNHVALGSGPVRLCALMDHPMLWVWEEGEPPRELLSDYFGETKEYDNGTLTVDGITYEWEYDRSGDRLWMRLAEFLAEQPEDDIQYTVWEGHCYLG